MAPSSGLYVSTRKAEADGTDTIIDWVNDTIKCALFTSSLTPNFSTDTVFSTTAEVTASTGYVTGGTTLTGKTVSESPAGTLKFTASTAQWFTSSITARCAVLYDTTVSNKLIACVDFGADKTSTGDTFTITWPAAGIWTEDVTP